MISLILIFFAGMLNAVMDILKVHYSKSIFSKWKNQNWINPSISWKNKWKNGDPTQGEKFLGSSTIFVFLTDLWHFSKFIMLLLFMSAVVFYTPLINWYVDILIYYCTFTIIFELCFSKIFNI